jgi:hypothetical protein
MRALVLPRRCGVFGLAGCALGAAACRGGAARESVAVVPTVLGPLAPAGDTPAGHAGVRAFAATGEARDGAVLEGKIFVGTPGGLLVYDPLAPGTAGAARLERTVTWIDGLASVDASVTVAWGDRLAVAGEAAAVTLLDRRGLQTLELPGAGAVSDLAASAGQLIIATQRGGLLAWDGRQAVRLLREEVTALAPDGERLAAATATGAVYARRTAGNLGLVARVDERVTALAWDGDALLVGHAFGLERVDADGTRHRLRADLSVTALLSDAAAGRVFVATAAAGVVALDGVGDRDRAAEERFLGRTRVTRLRALAGEAIAFGPNTAWRLTAAASLVDTIPAPLTEERVTAVAVAGEVVWVGSAAGVDVLDTAGEPLFHLALPPVNALRARPDRHDVIAATAEGAYLLSPPGGGGSAPAPRRIAGGEVLTGEVFDAAWLAGAALFATDRGVVVIGPDGAARERPSGKRIRTVGFGPGGRLYVGSDGGLTVLTPELELESSWLASRPVVGLAGDSAAMYATGPAGTYRLAPDGAVAVIGGPARALTIDAERLLSAGDAGPFATRRAQPGRWRPLGAGLAGVGTQGIAVDAAGGAFWIATDRGLLRVPREAAPGRS